MTTTDNKMFNLYYPTEQDCRNSVSKWSDTEIKEIKQNLDITYLSNIEEIKSKCNPEYRLDYRGRKVYTLPRKGGDILIRFYHQDSQYLDGLVYQRHDVSNLIEPSLWTLSTPKEFIELFLKPYVHKDEGFISLNELKKIKPTKFWNKNNQAFWYDSDGYFYHADKTSLPNKKSIALYNKISPHKDMAILARHTIKDDVYGNTTVSWFVSEAEMLECFKEIENSVPAWAAIPRFEVKKRGYTKPHPNDRKLIYRFPYFDLSTELKLTENNISRAARNWCLRITDTPYKTKWECVDLVEEIIKKYIIHITQ